MEIVFKLGKINFWVYGQINKCRFGGNILIVLSTCIYFISNLNVFHFYDIMVMCVYIGQFFFSYCRV